MNVDSFQESTVNTGRLLTLVVGLRAGHRVGRGSHGLLLSGEFAFAHARQSLLLRVATRLQHGAALDLGNCEIKLHIVVIHSKIVNQPFFTFLFYCILAICCIISIISKNI